MNLKRYIFALAVLCAALLPGAVLAQEAGDSVAPVVIEGASRMVYVPAVDEVPGPARAGETDHAQRSVRLVEMLETVPGVEVVEQGGDEGPWLLRVRGSDPEAVAVYLDGILLNDPLGNPVDLSGLPAPLVEEALVYRGSAPSGYPVSGTGGVVDIKTLPASQDLGGRASLSLDSISTAENSANVSGPVAYGGGIIASNHQWGKGHFEYLDDRGTYGSSGDDRPEIRFHNEFYDHDYMAKWDSKLGGFRIYTGWYMRERSHQLPGPGDAPARSAAESSRLSLYYAGVKRPGVGTPDLDLELRVNYLDESRKFYDEDGELGLPRSDDNRRTRFGIDIYLNYYGIPSNQISLYLGIYDDEYLPASDIDPKADNVNASRSSLFFNAADQISLIGGRLIVKPRARYFFESNDYNGPTLIGQTLGGNATSSYNVLTGDLSVNFAIVNDLWLVTSVGQYYMTPGLVQAYGDRVELIGNPDLNPQRSLNQEIGLVYDPGRLWNFDEFRAELLIFENQYYKRIGWVDAGGGQLEAQNIGDATVTGVSAAIHLNFSDLLDVDMSYTTQDTSVSSDIDALDGHKLAMIAPSVFRLGATAYQSYGKIYYELSYQDSRYLDPENRIGVGPRIVHNLGLVYYGGEFGFGVKAMNVSNDLSREVLGYPLPGARYMIYMEVNG